MKPRDPPPGQPLLSGFLGCNWSRVLAWEPPCQAELWRGGRERRAPDSNSFSLLSTPSLAVKHSTFSRSHPQVPPPAPGHQAFQGFQAHLFP